MKCLTNISWYLTATLWINSISAFQLFDSSCGEYLRLVFYLIHKVDFNLIAELSTSSITVTDVADIRVLVKISSFGFVANILSIPGLP